MKSVRTTNRRYDGHGIENGRIMRIVALWKLLGISGLSRSQGITTLWRLYLRQCFGKRLAVITVKHEQRWLRFLRTFRQRRALIARRAGLIRDKLLGRL